MKSRSFKTIFSFFLAVLMTVGMSATAFAADASVTFKENKVIVFGPGSTYTATDLFSNFKGVMPGDVLTEDIDIENQNSDYDNIKVYMRAVLHDEDGNPISEEVLEELLADGRRGSASELDYMYDFLSQLSMKVWNGSDLIFDGTLDQLDGLADNVYLGTLWQSETMSLKAELTVPIELDNAYANRIGEVDWVFAYEGFDAPIPELKVSKVWKDGNDSQRPSQIKVQLYQDGKPYDEPVILSASDGWIYVWKDLDAAYAWTVDEVDVPAGYTSIVTGTTTDVTITNTKDGKIVPKTGDTSYAGILLGVTGVSLLGLGFAGYRLRSSCKRQPKD